MKEEVITYNFKGFWGKLFCKHNWNTISNLSVYGSVEEQRAKLPKAIYLRWICTKCGKIKKIKLL